MRHSPDPETSPRVTAPIIGSIAGLIGFKRCEHFKFFGIYFIPVETIFRCDKQCSPVYDRCGRANEWKWCGVNMGASSMSAKKSRRPRYDGKVRFGT